MLRVVTWNVNSIKSRLQHLLNYIDQTSPDIILLQELKCTEENFPFMEIEDKGYNIAVNGQKTYNGVAILSKFPLEDVQKGLPGNDLDEQARYIEAVISLNGNAIRVASVYVPNGQSPESDKFPYKLGFLDALYQHSQTLLNYEEMLVIGGDYNIAPESQDVYAPKQLEGSCCFHKDERLRFRRFIANSLVDAYRVMHPNTLESYSWWDYRGGGWQRNQGLRIDHLLLSPEATDALIQTNIDTFTRAWERASDHAPVWIELKL
jgi:exodeoxyribonuclease-3